MTGEITLRGKVMEIGGVKEKVIAGYRAGLKTIILPKGNKKDMDDVPSEVKKSIKFVFVEDMREVLKLALTKDPFKEIAVGKNRDLSPSVLVA
jgi:ATP-dependent Lon protease